jgi:hypothetical protein
MKPEQLEIARLKREVIKLKAGRDILRKSRGLLRERIDVKFGFIAKHRDLGRGLDVRGAQCLAGRLLCLVDTTAQSTQPERRRAGRERSGRASWQQAGMA